MEINFRFVFLLVKYILFNFVSCILSFSYRKKDVFLISERGTEARDNGLYLFKYLKNEHPDIKVYFVISKDAVDVSNLAPFYDNIVNYKSFKHYLMLWRSKYLISTHLHGFSPEPRFSMYFNKRFHIYRKKVIVSLKHGITKDFLPVLKYDYSFLDLVVSGAKPEYDDMKQTFGYPEGHIQYLGFCRFDGLHNYKVKKQILLMPTWRKWLKKENFNSSDYCKQYLSLLSDDRLLSFLKDNNLKLIFYPHYEVQPYINVFKKISNDNIVIAEAKDFDVQTLLKESLLLITDYSSVLFDFAYMRKPIVFFQFDAERYRHDHYTKGYFDYNDSFGPVTTSIEDLLVYLEKYRNSDWELTEKYINKVAEYFPLCDSSNCERVFRRIYSIHK